MATIPDRASNEFEQRRWNDERWTEAWPKRELLTDEVTPFVLAAAALRPGERVLDVGCGGGKTTIAAARAVGAGGAAVGADISTGLAALASRRAGASGAANAEFHVLDMQADTVPGGPFDVALSQFGVMFFDEPVTAFRNIRAQLRPGGRLAFACWQAPEENPWFFAPAIAAFVPPPPPLAPGKSATGPFALADPEQTGAMLRSAGFGNVRRSAHRIAVEAPQDAVIDDVQFELMGLPADIVPVARRAALDHLQQFVVGPGRSRFPLAFQLFEATNA